MQEPSIPKKRWIELALISKAFLHQIATHETARHELLEALPKDPPDHEKPKTDRATERETELAFVTSIAIIVNRHLGLDEINLGLKPHEMEAFDFEMQKRHSETATPGTFTARSYAYSSKYAKGTGQGLGVTSTSGQQSGGNPPPQPPPTQT